MQVANWLQSQVKSFSAPLYIMQESYFMDCSLVPQGFKSVYNVAGGIQAYSLKVDPSIPTY